MGDEGVVCFCVEVNWLVFVMCEYMECGVDLVGFEVRLLVLDWIELI